MQHRRTADHEVLSHSAETATASSGPLLPPTPAAYSTLLCSEEAASVGRTERSGGHSGLVLSSPSGSPLTTSFRGDDAADMIRCELQRQLPPAVPSHPAAAAFMSGCRQHVAGWMLEVAAALPLSSPTLATAVSLMDRFLCNTQTPPDEGILQLLALTALSVAAKHSEVQQPRPEQWLELAVDPEGRPLYLVDDFVRMEWLLLETLNWQVYVPTAVGFLSRCLAALAADPRAAAALPRVPQESRDFKALATLLTELSLLFHTFLAFSSSTVAVACLALAEEARPCAAAPPAAGPQASGRAERGSPAILHIDSDPIGIQHASMDIGSPPAAAAVACGGLGCGIAAATTCSVFSPGQPSPVPMPAPNATDGARAAALAAAGPRAAAGPGPGPAAAAAGAAASGSSVQTHNAASGSGSGSGGGGGGGGSSGGTPSSAASVRPGGVVSVLLLLLGLPEHEVAPGLQQCQALMRDTYLHVLHGAGAQAEAEADAEDGARRRRVATALLARVG